MTYETITLNGEIFYVSPTEFAIENGKTTPLFEELSYDDMNYVKTTFDENQVKNQGIE